MPDQMQIIENTWIPMPDGRRLAARIWMPKGDGPFPAILEYLPYRKRDGTGPRDETTHPVFARAGYACLRVDISGSGDSDGLFDDEYSERELSDGEAVLDWIATRDWCSGDVGMIGISWGGFNGLQLAYRQPAPLKAVVSVASTTDRYADDIHFMGGCLLSDNFNWSSQMFAYQTRPLDPTLSPDWRADWIRRMENVPFMAADWLEHPTRDAFWKHGSVCEDFSRIKAPVLAMTGWADAYVNAPSRLAANLSTPCKAVMGPWEHRYAHIAKLQPADFHGEVLTWFDRWLKGIDNGAEDLPDYRVFLQDHFQPTQHNSPRKGRWVAEASWPSPNVASRTLHLTPGGLSQSMGLGSAVVSSPADLGGAGGYFCAGMRIDNELAGDQAGDDAMSTCFDTEPIEKPLELLGRPVLRFTFSVDKPVAQLVARLCDVAPDGTSLRISYRPLNLCHHASHETPEKLVPGKQYQARIDLNECGHRLLPGHRLRLALSTNYWPIVWPSPERCAVSLDLGACTLELPVRQVSEEPNPQNPGPPRDFPVLEARELRPASGKSESLVLPDGTRVLETFDDYGKAQDPYHGLIVGSHVAMRYAIHPDDPASARMDESWQFTFERGDWNVTIDTENTMTCDQGEFHMTRRVRATEGGDATQVFARDWQRSLPRGLL